LQPVFVTCRIWGLVNPFLFPLLLSPSSTISLRHFYYTIYGARATSSSAAASSTKHRIQASIYASARHPSSTDAAKRYTLEPSAALGFMASTKSLRT
jgi:hypothetical protein